MFPSPHAKTGGLGERARLCFAQELEALEVDRERISAQTAEIEKIINHHTHGRRTEIAHMLTETSQQQGLGAKVRSGKQWSFLHMPCAGVALAADALLLCAV